MQIVEKNIKDLKPYEANPRRNDEAVEYVANSIKEFGFKVPIVIDKEGVIVAGHTRLKAAKKLRLKKVPCIIADDLTEEQVRAFRLADNKVAEKAEWNDELLDFELEQITNLDMDIFGFGDEKEEGFTAENEAWGEYDEEDEVDERDPSCQHNVFENQEVMQFPCVNKYGIPVMKATQTVGDKMLRFMDWKEVEDRENYIAHFYYDDYKFMSAWRDPNKYLDRLREFKAVISPNFSLYTDFPIALQILSCYRRNWCGAYWQMLGIDVIPNVCWGEKASYEFCFEGIPKNSTVSVSTVGVKNDKEWNNGIASLFLDGYNEMLNRLEPTTILFYGDMIEGAEGNIIRIPSYYEQKRTILNARSKKET